MKPITLSDSDPVILFVSRHPPLSHPPPTDGRVHGGIRRTAQVAELIARTGLPALWLTSFGWNPGTIREVVRGLPIWVLENCRVPIARRDVRQVRAIGRTRVPSSCYQQLLKSFPNGRVVVLEDTRKSLGLVWAAKALGRRVVCAPHDIENLSTGEVQHNSGMQPFRRLRAEIAALGQADAVYTISFEEQLFLRSVGIPAEHLPYYPAEADRPKLRDVRQKRLTSEKSHFLIFGGASHPPTREGLVELLGWIENDPGFCGMMFVLAGADTESIHIPLLRTRVLGRVSDQELVSLLASARGIIVNQRYGSGALTKIPESLCAGVPIFANTVAARSYFGRHGMQVFTTPQQLSAQLRIEVPDPVCCAPPVASEEQFIKTIVDAAATKKSFAG